MNLVPKEEAIQQAIEATGLPEATIREYAERLKNMNPMFSAGAIVATSPGLQKLFKLAADAEAAGIRADRGRIPFNGQDLTPYIETVQLGAHSAHMPHNPANRRTFRLAGKPHHFIQTEDGLATRPGESPWE